MTTDAEDRSTWPRNGQVIRRDELLRLIEENGGPWDLDLRGAVFVGDGPSDNPYENPIDVRRKTLEPLAEAHRLANGGSDPPWLGSNGCIDLSGADLQATQLCRAQLQQADLSGTQLQDANLPGAQLQGAVLTGAHLHELDMYDVGTLDGASWYRAFLDHTRIRRAKLGDALGDELLAQDCGKSGAYVLALISYAQAKETYLLLKNNFNQIGRYEDASWAYVKEQQMERMAFYWEWRFHGWKVWRAWGSFRRWVRNRAYEWLTGYGEEPLKAVRAGGVVVLLFAVAYWLLGALGGHARPGWFTSWNPADIDWSGFLDGIIYSVATFATFNLARPAINPEGRVWEAVSSVEAILGISVLALVVFTVGNRMSRS